MFGNFFCFCESGPAEMKFMRAFSWREEKATLKRREKIPRYGDTTPRRGFAPPRGALNGTLIRHACGPSLRGGHLPPGEGKSTGPPLSHTNGAGAPWGLSSRAVPPSRAPNHSFLKVFGILKGLQTSPQANLPRACEEVFKKPLSRRRHVLSPPPMGLGPHGGYRVAPCLRVAP